MIPLFGIVVVVVAIVVVADVRVVVGIIIRIGGVPWTCRAFLPVIRRSCQVAIVFKFMFQTVSMERQ